MPVLFSCTTSLQTVIVMTEKLTVGFLQKHERAEDLSLFLMMSLGLVLFLKHGLLCIFDCTDSGQLLILLWLDLSEQMN